MIAQPQCAHRGAIAWIAHSKESNVRAGPAATLISIALSYSFPQTSHVGTISLRSGLLAVDGALELVLVHRRAALDVELLGLLVELVARAALGPTGSRPLPAAARGRHVLRRRPRPLPRLA